MRTHFILNQGGTALGSKLADVEIHFEEGILAGVKLVGCSVWRSKKDEKPTVLVPSRSYATVAGVRYYEMIRSSADDDKTAVRDFKDNILDEYFKIVKGAE